MRTTLRTLTLCLLIAFAPEFAGAQYQPDAQYSPVPARRPVPAAPVPAAPVPAAPVPAPATSASAQQYLHVGRAGARWP